MTGDEAERAYRRGDALEKRRALMAKWAAFQPGKLRPEKSTEALPVNVIRKLRGRAQQAQDAGEPYLAADLRLAATTIERLDH